MNAIPAIPLVTERPVQLNSRLWELHAKSAARTITPNEDAELDAMCAALEAKWAEENAAEDTEAMRRFNEGEGL